MAVASEKRREERRHERKEGASEEEQLMDASVGAALCLVSA